VRGIAAAVRRFVCERDGDRCTFESAGGKRCPERDRLEFHHDEPYALGGNRSAMNIRLLCHEHNAYLAELDYGKEKMDQYRRSADRVGEPLPTLALRPDASSYAIIAADDGTELEVKRSPLERPPSSCRFFAPLRLCAFALIFSAPLNRRRVLCGR